MRFRIIPIICCILPLWPLPQASAGEDRFVDGEVIVTFKQDIAPGAARTTLARRTLDLTEHYDGISGKRRRVCGMIRAKGRTTAQLIAELKEDPDVANVEPNYLRHICTTTPGDPDFAKQWGLANTGQMVNSTTGTSGVDTRFLAAWNLSRTTSGEVVIGIIDTGIDITHPDLAENIWGNPGEIAGNGIDDDGDGYIDDVHGYDFAAGTNTITDSGYHGTHIAGAIAACGNNNTGVIGLQYHAKILPLKVSTDGESMSSSAIISACNYAVKLKQSGINIVAINASYGGVSYSTGESNAIAALRDVGIIFCAAAGNSGTNNDINATYPASYAISNIITVAALTQTNGLADFSNYGASTVDLAAPGVNVYSTKPLALAGKNSSVKVGTITYGAQELTYSGTTTGLTKPIYNCGTGISADSFPAEVSGNIALIQRGTNTFADKVSRAKAAGAAAVIIHDNVSNPLSAGSWTLGTAGTWLPVLQVTQATGAAILAGLPTTATFVNAADPLLAYQFLDGTSMATSYVTAAAAFAAWNFPSEPMTERLSRILTHTTAIAALGGKMKTGGRLDLLNMIDTDNDGLPDWWELENFNSLVQSAAGDADGDGFTNLTEYLSGTNPVSGFSGPAPELGIEQPLGTDLPDGATKDFGQVSVGSNHRLNFTIKNTGTANLTGLMITIDGANAADFTIASTPVAPVNGPTGTTSFVVQFTPTATGTRAAALHVTSNDTDESPFDINLTGTGMSTDPFIICFVGTRFEPRVGNFITFDLKKLLAAGQTIKLLGKLPTGLKFNTSTGLITGTISGKPGIYQASVQILEGRTLVRTVPFPITVLAFPSSLIGTFDGLLEDADARPGGALRLTITGANVWTATLESTGAAKRSAKGAFILGEGSPIAPITAVFPAAAGAPAVTVNLTIDGTTPTFAGSYNGGTLRGFRLASGAELPPATKTCNLVIDAGVQDGLTIPAGLGWLKGSWGTTGIGTFKGLLGDGTAATITLRLSPSGQAVLWVQPYTNKNSYLGGIVTLDHLGQAASGNPTLTDSVWWAKSADAKTLSYPDGFEAMPVTLGASRWTAPATASALGTSLGWSDNHTAAVTIDGAGLSNEEPQVTTAALPTEFTLDDKFNLAVSAPVAGVRVAWTGKVVKTDGSFTGTLTLPSGFSSSIPSGAAAVSGVLVQDRSWDTVTGCGLIKVPASGAKGSFRTAEFAVGQ